MKYYHATGVENSGKILVEGLKAGIDGGVYLCEKPEDAMKFLYIRGITTIDIYEVTRIIRNLLRALTIHLSFLNADVGCI